MQPKFLMRFTIAAVLAFGAGLQPVECQHTGGGGGAGGGGAGGGGAAGAGAGRSTLPSTTTPGGTTTAAPPGSLNRGIYLSGKVQMDDGSTPPELVLIERVCSGNPRPEGYTDSKGRFSFQLGQNQVVTEDASYDNTTATGMPPNTMARPRAGSGASQASSGITRRTGMDPLAGCDLRASLPGFRSDLVNLTGHRILDNPDVGTLILHRIAGVEGSSISMTTLAAPKDARKAYDKARELLKKGKVADAQMNFEKAVASYPKFAAAWYELGFIHENSNDPGEARKYYAQALTADSKLVTPYLGLARLGTREKNWQEVSETTSRLIRLDPVDFAEAYYLNAFANYRLHRLNEAEKSARDGERIDTAHHYPGLHQVLGAILYEKQDYAGAAEHLRDYLQFSPNAPDADQVKKQLAALDRITGETKVQAEKPQL
ncbi:MAG TPA: tetratricopeptide repeat protein [Bryobacteraceae bacterium]|nr:tetratricopeptide repeat protein [Bryobacteraceae bacterium]